MKLRRIGLFLLVLVMVLSAMPTAMAKQIEIYGDGTKTQIVQTDGQGREFIYYDILKGSKKRDDTKDSDRFVRVALNSIVSHGYSLARQWDIMLRNEIGDVIAERYDGKTLYEWYNYLYDKGEFGTFDSSVLVMSGNAENTERAIREKVAGLTRHIDPYVRPEIFPEIKGLKALNFKGPSYFTVNTGIKKGTAVVAYGSIFYDFQHVYLEDGKVADSAVGAETDINKVKGNRGFKAEESNPTPSKSSVAENATRKPISQTVTMSQEYSNSATHSVETSDTTTKGFNVGTEIEFKKKIPLLAETTIKVKAEYNMSWAATTTHGKSETKTKTEKYENSVTVEVPPRSRMKVDMMNQNVSYSIDYDYPIGINYKVAQYVIFNENQAFIAAVFGEGNDADNGTAAQNLRNRVDHRNSDGYESQHCSGRPINWNRVDINTYYVVNPGKYIPMSITGGRLGLSGDSLFLKVNEPAPMLPINRLSLETGSPKMLTMPVNGKLDLYSNLSVQAMDGGYEGEEPMETYGFDDEEHGKWVLCNEEGAAIGDNDLAHVEDGGRLVAGAAPAAVYLKYLLDEQSYPYAKEVRLTGAGTEQESGELVLGYSSNDKIVNDTLVKVNIASELPPFVGTVALKGELKVPFADKVSLNRLDVEVRDGAGQVVTRRDLPLQWFWDGEAVSGDVVGDKSGEHRVKVNYGGVDSNEIVVVVSPAAQPERIELNAAALTLDKGESAQLVATLYPSDADIASVSWRSSDDAVATVEGGKVVAQGTGKAAIACMAGDVFAVCDVTVETAQTGKALNQGKVSLAKGKKFTLGAPGGASGTWTVKDERIAKVTPAGKVTAKALGETELTFTVEAAKEGAKFLNKAVFAGDRIILPLVVRKIGEVVSKVSVPEKKVKIAVGEARTLLPKLKPAKAPDLETYFQSNNKKSVLVDDQGMITGVSPGKATITITSASGKAVKVTVTVVKDAASIHLNAKKKKLVVGECFSLIATPVPEIPSFAPIYSSKNEKVATVDENGVIVALKKGKTVITVFADVTKKIKAQCTVTVK